MMNSLGDLAMSLSSRLANVRIRTEMNTLAGEMTSGRKADIRTPLNGDLGPLVSIERSLSHLGAYATVIDESTLFVSAMQQSLAQVSGHLHYLAKAAIDMESTLNPALIANFGADAETRFEALVANLNGAIGGRYLFAGADTDTRPLAAPAAILDDLAASLPPGALADDISAAVDAYFAPGGGFDATGYLGASVPLAPFRVSAEDGLSLDVTGRHDAVRHALGATAKAAMLARGALAGNIVEQRKMIRATGIDMLAAEAGVVALRGEVGLVESRMDAAQTRNATEAGSLRVARSALIGADPFDTATRLQEVQTQLETFYAVTARLSRLSFAGFLR